MKVKWLFLLTVFLEFSGAGNCQSTSNLTAEDVIKRIIFSAAHEGNDNRVIGWMGDAAAVVVTRVVAGRKLATSEMDGVLIVLDASYGDPGMVEVAADRQPKTTLFVLEYLACSATDPALRRRIADARKYVEAHYAESLKKVPPEQ